MPAPNQRPIQVTDDLTAFWRDMYPKVKAELSRRIRGMSGGEKSTSINPTPF